MIAHLLGSDTGDHAGATDALDLSPMCGWDFCDQCSDCLVCCREDECLPEGGAHVWVVYPEQIADFRARYHLSVSQDDPPYGVFGEGSQIEPEVCAVHPDPEESA